jgi:hypothetical protein
VTRHRTRGAAWLVVGTTVVFLLLTLVLEAVGDRLDLHWVRDTYGPVLFALTYAGVGALVISRQPGNAIGWIFSTVGLLQATNTFGDAYVHVAVVTHPGSLPGSEAMAWFKEWNWFPSLALVATFLLLLFPNGQLLSPRWRWVAWSTAIAIAVVVTAMAIALWPGRRDIALGVSADESNMPSPLGAVVVAAGVILVLGVVASVGSLVVRFRRSRGVERQQLKWFTFAGAFGAASVMAAFLPVESNLLGVVLIAGGLSIPAAAAIAILRYRLYDIDVVINRTLVYGSVTALLAGAYLGCVLLLQYALHPVTKGNGLAVALSTLAVAALFRPVRNRIQALVDRRFYRRKYDAQRTLEGFASRLREEVDLDALRAELTGVVAETMQPAHVSLWLREVGR